MRHHDWSKPYVASARTVARYNKLRTVPDSHHEWIREAFNESMEPEPLSPAQFDVRNISREAYEEFVQEPVPEDAVRLLFGIGHTGNVLPHLNLFCIAELASPEESDARNRRALELVRFVDEHIADIACPDINARSLRVRQRLARDRDGKVFDVQRSARSLLRLRSDFRPIPDDARLAVTLCTIPLEASA
jgi:hypothetical protein